MSAFICKIVVLLTACSALTACAIHPLPGDVTGYNTIDITNHIRCEARQAVQDKAIDLLEHSGTTGGTSLAAELKADRSRFHEFKRGMLRDPRQRAFYDRYIKTAIAYDFSFDMTEEENASTQIDFAKAFTGGAVSLAAGASNQSSRQNIRKFLIAETFQKLLDDRRLDEKCLTAPFGPNFLYPISGRIGLGEVISTFIDLNESIELKQKDSSAPAMGDTLQFNTTFMGSINPKIILTPVGMPAGSRFRLADAALNTSASRTDKHQLIVGLSVPPKDDKKSSAPQFPIGIGVLTKSVFSVRGGTPAEDRAIQAITQLRIDLYYDRTSQVGLLR